MRAQTPYSGMTFSPRPHYEWALRTRSLPLGRRTVLLGVLNLTPDSFSDGGSYLTTDSAADRALQMLDEGADIVDIGGESTRPGATPLAVIEEQARVLPVASAILRRRRDAILSIDTYHAGTARLAVEAGAEIVNDVSGHLWDADMAKTCADLRCGVVMMHTRGRPSEWKTQAALATGEVSPAVRSGLAHQLQRALDAGIARNQIVLDPGFGFGKIGRENDPLLSSLYELQQLGRPILVGLSRKSFLRLAATPATASEQKAQLLSATLAATTVAILAGAHLIRVHDVAEARAAAMVADRVLGTTGSS
jgi:dihydropteroate synthase